MNRKVIVLLSTYNGEHYIEEQIDSILNQKDVDVSLLVRDDGSIDNTVLVLKHYVAENDNVILSDDTGNLGVGNSFMKLLSIAGDYDYYAFADQDDVWDEDKLISAVKSIGQEEKPILYCCNQRNVDEDRNFLNVRFLDSYRPPSLISAVFANYYAGCAMVMNRELRNLLIQENNLPDEEFFKHRIHDAWVTCVALATGTIYYDKQPHMDFRRSGNNYSDEYAPGSKTSYFKRYYGKLRRLRSGKLKKNGCSLTAAELIARFPDYLSPEQKKCLLEIMNYKRSFGSRIRFILSKTVKTNLSGNRLAFMAKVLIGIL